MLAAAVTRSRRFRTRNPLVATDFAAALGAVGCTVDDTGRWHPPAGAVPSARDQVIVTRSAGRDLTRQEMIYDLLAAGYSASSATGRMSSTHPLFQRAGPDRYRVISDPDRC